MDSCSRCKTKVENYLSLKDKFKDAPFLGWRQMRVAFAELSAKRTCDDNKFDYHVILKSCQEDRVAKPA